MVGCELLKWAADDSRNSYDLVFHTCPLGKPLFVRRAVYTMGLSS